MLTNLYLERKRRGLTREQLADALSVHANTISAWERGETEPKASQAIQLAQFFDVDIEYLLGLVKGGKDG